MPFWEKWRLPILVDRQQTESDKALPVNSIAP